MSVKYSEISGFLFPTMTAVIILNIIPLFLQFNFHYTTSFVALFKVILYNVQENEMRSEKGP